MRIVSLIPSSTEIICALGFEEALVGRSHECDYPPTISHLPILTAPKFEPDGRSYEINERVKAILQESLSVYQLDAPLLNQLAPDIIVTQSQCEVCAVSFAEVQQIADAWLDKPARIVSLEPNSLSDAFDDIKRVAHALGVPERGEDLVRDLQRQMVIISQRAKMMQYRPNVLFVEWIDPLMAGGNWMPTLIEMVNAYPLLGIAGEHSPWITWEQLKDANPDIILIAPCGYSIQQSLDNLSPLVNHPDFGRLKAVQAGEVYIADGHQFFNRPGPRLVESLEILAEIVHPHMFGFGHEGRGWIRL